MTTIVAFNPRKGIYVFDYFGLNRIAMLSFRVFTFFFFFAVVTQQVKLSKLSLYIHK